MKYLPIFLVMTALFFPLNCNAEQLTAALFKLPTVITQPNASSESPEQQRIRTSQADYDAKAKVYCERYGVKTPPGGMIANLGVYCKGDREWNMECWDDLVSKSGYKVPSKKTSPK